MCIQCVICRPYLQAEVAELRSRAAAEAAMVEQLTAALTALKDAHEEALAVPTQLESRFEGQHRELLAEIAVQRAAWEAAFDTETDGDNELHHAATLLDLVKAFAIYRRNSQSTYQSSGKHQRIR